jgi:hypothetical protein
MPEDLIVVPDPEFGRLRHAIAIATERFKQATEEKQGLLSLFASLQTITEEDRKDLADQIEVEEAGYDAIKELHEKILGLLREKPQAKAATNHP